MTFYLHLQPYITGMLVGTNLGDDRVTGIHKDINIRNHYRSTERSYFIRYYRTHFIRYYRTRSQWVLHSLTIGQKHTMRFSQKHLERLRKIKLYLYVVLSLWITMILNQNKSGMNMQNELVSKNQQGRLRHENFLDKIILLVGYIQTPRKSTSYITANSWIIWMKKWAQTRPST